jgi:NAD(P)-dependent dehydrogenase (short-subunit alcohol dehydrogenase family)
MVDLLRNRVAVVTGAGRGLGRAHAILLAAQGAKLVVNDLGCAGDGSGDSRSPADEVVEEIKKKGGLAVADYNSVSSEEGARNIIKAALDNFDRVDILVNNAGILRDRMIFNMTSAEWDEVIKTHLYGTFFCTRYACPHMIEQKYGRIINTSSHAGLGNLGQANYSAAKEGIVGFTRTIARELGRHGITCNVIRPLGGTRLAINEPLKQAWIKKFGPAAETQINKWEKELRPEDIGVLVAYLASERAENINGCVFEVWHGHIGIFVDPPPVAQILWKDGNWTAEELGNLMPKTLARGKKRELTPAAFSIADLF